MVMKHLSESPPFVSAEQSLIGADAALSDETLRGRFVSCGDESAFRSLVCRHARLVWLTARRRCESDADADEVAQDVFLVLARKAPGLRAEAGLAAWLHRVAVILSIKSASRAANQRRRQQEAVKAAHRESDIAGIAAAPASRGEWTAGLDEALDRLPQADRSLLIWKYLEGRTIVDIARRLGKTEAAVQKQGERALEHLRRSFHRLGLVGSAAVILSSLIQVTYAASDRALGKAGGWAQKALLQSAFPRGYALPNRAAHCWRRLRVTKWLVPLGLAATTAITVWLCLPSMPPPGEKVPKHEITPRDRLPASSFTARGHSSPDAENFLPPVEPALTREQERRMAARRALHLATLADRLGLDDAQQEATERLYDAHQMAAAHRLGRQGNLVIEVITNRDALGMGSLGPLSLKRLDFESALAGLLSQEQHVRWEKWQNEVRQNALDCRLNRYLGNWMLINGTGASDVDSLRSYFTELATDDIHWHDGFMALGEGAFHIPPYFELHEKAAMALPEAEFRRFREWAGIADFATEPTVMRNHSIQRSLTAATIEAWKRQLASCAPDPRGRMLVELGNLQAMLILDPAQRDSIQAALLRRAESESLDEWLGPDLGSDQDFMARRAADADLLNPFLSRLQQDVVQGAPLPKPEVGEGYTHSARWDARAR